MNPIFIYLFFAVIITLIILTIAGIYSMYEHMKIVDLIMNDNKNQNEK